MGESCGQDESRSSSFLEDNVSSATAFILEEQLLLDRIQRLPFASANTSRFLQPRQQTQQRPKAAQQSQLSARLQAEKQQKNLTRASAQQPGVDRQQGASLNSTDLPGPIFVARPKKSFLNQCLGSCFGRNVATQAVLNPDADSGDRSGDEVVSPQSENQAAEASAQIVSEASPQGGESSARGCAACGPLPVVIVRDTYSPEKLDEIYNKPLFEENRLSRQSSPAPIFIGTLTGNLEQSNSPKEREIALRVLSRHSTSKIDAMDLNIVRQGSKRCIAARTELAENIQNFVSLSNQTSELDNQLSQSLSGPGEPSVGEDSSIKDKRSSEAEIQPLVSGTDFSNQAVPESERNLLKAECNSLKAQRDSSQQQSEKLLDYIYEGLFEKNKVVTLAGTAEAAARAYKDVVQVTAPFFTELSREATLKEKLANLADSELALDSTPEDGFFSLQRVRDYLCREGTFFDLMDRQDYILQNVFDKESGRADTKADWVFQHLKEKHSSYCF